MSSWKACGPCSLSSQYGSYTAFPRLIVKQPGAVRGSVEIQGGEGREVERRTALIRSRETPFPFPPPVSHPLPFPWQRATVTFPVNDSCSKQQGDLEALCLTSFKLAPFFFLPFSGCCCLLLTLLIKVATINQFLLNNYMPGDTERAMKIL